MSIATPEQMPIAESGPVDPTARLLGERFEFLGVLGLPGPGKYYSVLDRREGRCTGRGETSLVLRVPSADANTEGMELELFLAQTRAASVLNHKNITPVVDSDELNGVHYCLLRFPAEFETLRGILLRRGWLSIEDRLAYGTMLQVSDALAHAHDNAVLHLLVRPEHILIDPSGDAFLTGFGLSQNDLSQPLLLAELARTAAPEYISPEMRDGTPLTERTDLYSLGATLYEMTTDRVPRHAAALAGRRQAGAPIAPHLVVETISPPVSRLIMRMLEDDPKSRFWGISEFRDVLTAAIEPVQTPIETGTWPLELMHPAIKVMEGGNGAILIGEPAIATAAQETAEYPEIQEPVSDEPETTPELQNTIEAGDIVSVLPGLPLGHRAWLPREPEFSDNLAAIEALQHTEPLSKDDVVDLREQIIIREAGGASADRAGGLVAFGQVDQSFGIDRVFLLAAGFIVLISAAVLIATQRATGIRNNESTLDIEQVQAPPAVTNQTGTPNRREGRQNDAVRPERRPSDNGNIEGNRAPARASSQVTRPWFRRPFKRHRRVQAGVSTAPRARSYWRRSAYYY